jgi:hypothetical protein
VPTVEFPLAVPFTDHVTAVFVLFVTVAVNVVGLPTRTDAVAGLTDTVVTAGGGGGGGSPVPWLEVSPEHPAMESTRTRINEAADTCLSESRLPHIKPLTLRAGADGIRRTPRHKTFRSCRIISKEL